MRSKKLPLKTVNSRKEREMQLEDLIDLSTERLKSSLEDPKSKIPPQVLNVILGTMWDKRYKEPEQIKTHNVILNLFGSVQGGLGKAMQLLPPSIKQVLDQQGQGIDPPKKICLTKADKARQDPTPTLGEESQDGQVPVISTAIQGQDLEE